jgi:hypothetical protein
VENAGRESGEQPEQSVEGRLIGVDGDQASRKRKLQAAPMSERVGGAVKPTGSRKANHDRGSVQTGARRRVSPEESETDR